MYIGARKTEKKWILSNLTNIMDENDFDKLSWLELYNILTEKRVETALKKYGLWVIAVLSITPQLIANNKINVL